MLLILTLAAALVPLTPGARHTHTLLPEATAQFEIESPEGHVIAADIDQGETDLTITVFGPDGRALLVRDGRERGLEPVMLVADRAGTYRLEVRTVGRARTPTVLHVSLEPLRPRTADDKSRIDAEQWSTDARRLGKAITDSESLSQALDLRERALPTWRALDRRDQILGTMGALGDLNYRLARFDEARRRYTDALTTSREWGALRDEAELTNNLGTTALGQGKLVEAREWFERALPLWDRVSLPLGASLTLNNLGIMLRQSGDYDAARQSYLRALAIAERIDDQGAAALALSNMGVVMDALGRTREAIAYYRRGTRIFEQLKSPVNQGRSLLSQARAEWAIGIPAALTHARQAVALIGGGSLIAAGDATLLIARLLDQQGQRAAAGDEYQRALALYRKVGTARGEADALHAIGVSLSGGVDTVTPLGHLDEARAIRKRLGLRAPEAETLMEIGRLRRRRGELAEAQEAMASAIAIVEDIQSTVFERQLRTSYLAAVMRYFADYTGVLIDRHAQDPNGGFAALAFQAAERAKARGVIERIQERQLIASPSAPAELLNRYRELGRVVSYWSMQLFQQADSAKAAGASGSTAESLDAARAAHRALEGDIRRADPRYRQLMQPESIDLAALQRMLGDDTVLVKFFLGDRESYAWAVTATQLTAVRLRARRTIESHAREFARLSSLNPEEPANAGIGARRDAHREELTRLLLAPLRPVLAARRLVIVADGALHAVPFSALSRPGRQTLIGSTHEVVVSPSATLHAWLENERQSRVPAPRTVAAIGDPVFGPSDTRVTRRTGAPPAQASRRLSRLPSTRGEVAHLLSLKPGNSLSALDFEASRALLPSLPHYRYVHFATHAIDDEARPELSGIVLSLVDRQGRPQDGFLRLNDIVSLNLRAELVVLSACQTAAGRLAAGEGVISLAQAFFYGGALRVLATLWPVTDDATAEMMRHYYAALFTRGESPAAALRSAQAAMRGQARFRDQFYWSGFVLQGAS
jgi:CHAT domain-containing protein/Tfp pilus assembly protein PilF